MSSAIIGASRPEQVTENVKAAGVTLDEALLKQIDETLGAVVERDPAKTARERAAEPAGMSWTWRFENAAGKEVNGGDLAGAEFSAQGDAETWLGEIWRELTDNGVDQVVLLEDGREVYGPMSLHP